MTFYKRHAPDHREHQRALADHSGFAGWKAQGGDGVLVRGIDDLEGLRGKEILLAELSVSHYLLVRGLDSVGMKESDVKIKNTDGDEAGKAFVADPKVEAVTTWNPHLFQATEAGKGKVIFSSKQILGEIIDLLVVNHKALDEAPRLGTVLTEAWYDAMRAMLAKDPRAPAAGSRIVIDRRSARARRSTPPRPRSCSAMFATLASPDHRS